MKRSDRKTAEGIPWQLTPAEVKSLIRYVKRTKFRKMKHRLWTRRYRKDHGV